MEQWSYYGEQYLASQQPVQTQTYAAPVEPVYSAPAEPAYVDYQAPQPTTQFSNPTPVTPATEPDLSLLERTMVQEPAPTPASQALADLLDDLDI